MSSWPRVRLSGLRVSGLPPSGVRPWGLAIAAGIAVGAWAFQTGAGAEGSPPALLVALRPALGAAWLTVVLIILAQEARRLLGGFTGAARAAGPTVGYASRPMGARRLPFAREVAPSPAGGHITWSTAVRRAVLVSIVTLPRYLADPVGHLVAAWWLVILLVCGYVYLEPVLGARRATAYWIAAAVLLLPWGTRAVAVRWPPFT